MFDALKIPLKKMHVHSAIVPTGTPTNKNNVKKKKNSHTKKEKVFPENQYDISIHSTYIHTAMGNNHFTTILQHTYRHLQIRARKQARTHTNIDITTKASANTNIVTEQISVTIKDVFSQKALKD